MGVRSQCSRLQPPFCHPVHKILDPKKLTGLWLDGRMICIVFVVQQCNSSKCAIIIMMRRLQWNWTLFPSSPHFGLAKINLFSDAIVFCFVNYSEQLQKKLFQIQGWSQKTFEKHHTIIQRVKDQSNFWNRICFNLLLEVPMKFNTLEQLRCKLAKTIGI